MPINNKDKEEDIRNIVIMLMMAMKVRKSICTLEIWMQLVLRIDYVHHAIGGCHFLMKRQVRIDDGISQQPLRHPMETHANR